MRHDVWFGEELQVSDRGDDPDEEERRPEHRKRHVPELPPRPRAVDARRLVELLRDVLQPGHEDDHVVAEVLPHRERDDGWHRPSRVAEPIDRRQSDAGQNAVQHPEARVVEKPKNHRDRDEC